MFHSDENIHVDDYVGDVIYTAARNSVTRPPSDGALDASSFCGLDAASSPQRGMQGVVRQGSGEQIVTDCRDKEQTSHKSYGEMEDDKVRPPVSTFSARGDEANHNVLHAQDSNENALFLQDSFHETENLINCRSHHEIKTTGSDVVIRRSRGFSSDGDLIVGSGTSNPRDQTRTYDDHFMPNDFDSSKGVRRKGDGKGSKHQQNSKSQSRRPNVSEHKETLTYADADTRDVTDDKRLSKVQEQRLAEEGYVRRMFWIRANDNLQGISSNYSKFSMICGHFQHQNREWKCPPIHFF